MAKARAARIGVDQAQAGQAPGPAYHEVTPDILRRRESENAVRIWIVTKRGRERHLDSGTGEIDRGVEGIAAAGQGVTAISTAREFDHHLPDGDHPGACFAHDTRLSDRSVRPR